MKKVLILCTGNSCRSIMAEGLINKYFPNIKAYSAGSKPSGRVNPNAKKVLIEENAWKDEYHSKSIQEIMNKSPFDLAITVCDNAAKECPVIPGTKTIHIPFEDPDGKDYEEFLKTKEEIKKRLFSALHTHFQV
ncbi:low molecular weight phosphatase family protein [Nautilia sp. PV-1]|uniref:arsenate reductase ArsC n=1 Tax=Nautilia sp. PV-1 TaxID=2579250 RepID=UPI000FDA6931|nr:arsenate reductase ArsC [Nautilia sp. PV-1]AZV46106.1 low molecular weight phosphatase family protein [Nautilia sp. PV-1]